MLYVVYVFLCVVLCDVLCERVVCVLSLCFEFVF